MVTRRGFLKWSIGTAAAAAAKLYCPNLVDKALAGSVEEYNFPANVDPFAEDIRISNGVRGSLDKLLPGCEYLTWGDATTNSYQKGVYLPSTFDMLFTIADTGSCIEKFVEPRLAEIGCSWGDKDMTVTSFYRPFWRDEELSPLNDKRRVHPEGLAIDFGSWKFLDDKRRSRFYRLCDKDWNGGFKITGSKKNTFHMDACYDRERRFGRRSF